jgi:hypothetical protein
VILNHPLKIIFLQVILSFQKHIDSIDNTSYNTLLEMRHLTGFLVLLQVSKIAKFRSDLKQIC